MNTRDTPGPVGLLIGYGSIGRRHLTNLFDLGVRDWAVVHTGKGTLPLEPPCEVRTYSTLADALAVEHPDLAVIANPTSLHVPAADACVGRVPNLLLEKPVADHLDGLDHLAARVAEHRTRVLVGFQFRFHPALRRIAELVREDAVGRPLRVSASWGEYLPDWHPWEDWKSGYAARADLGGGVHHTICHPFDYLRMLFGDPLRVGGVLSDVHPLGLEVPESADVELTFPGGIDAHVHVDYWARPRSHRVELTGTEGSVVWDYLAGELGIWRASSGDWDAEAVPGVDDRNELFVSLASHFLDVVAGVATPICTLEDGIKAVEIAAAVPTSGTTRSPTTSP